MPIGLIGQQPVFQRTSDIVQLGNGLWMDSTNIRIKINEIISSGGAAPLSNLTPSPVGTAGPGAGVECSRYDHIHGKGTLGDTVASETVTQPWTFSEIDFGTGHTGLLFKSVHTFVRSWTMFSTGGSLYLESDDPGVHTFSVGFAGSTASFAVNGSISAETLLSAKTFVSLFDAVDPGSTAASCKLFSGSGDLYVRSATNSIRITNATRLNDCTTLMGYADTDFPRKAENATVSGAWTFSATETFTKTSGIAINVTGSGGTVYLGSSIGVTTKLNIYTSTAELGAYCYGAYVMAINDSSNGCEGVTCQARHSNASSAGTIYGGHFYARCALSGSSQPASTLTGGYFVTDYSAGYSGTIGTGKGGLFEVQAIRNAGIFTAGIGVDVVGTTSGGGQITTFTGVRVQAPSLSGAGSMTTNYGIRVADQTNSILTTMHAIYVDSQSSYSDAARGNFVMAGGDYNTGHVQLGTGHIWATSGVVRIQDGAPASATDAVIHIGTNQISFFSTTTPASRQAQAAATNTKSAATFDTTTITLPQLAAVVGNMIDIFRTYGLFG